MTFFHKILLENSDGFKMHIIKLINFPFSTTMDAIHRKDVKDKKLEKSRLNARLNFYVFTTKTFIFKSFTVYVLLFNFVLQVSETLIN